MRLGILVCVLAGLAPQAGATEEESIPATISFGVPARADRVAAAVEKAGTDGAALLALADALGAAGGIEAARGLGSLLGSRDAAVRIKAMEALTRVGLRWEAHAESIQRRMRDPRATKAEWIAGLAALGAVGDGRDMPLLLAFARADVPDLSVRTAAFRAMAAMSGARIPYTHARWSYWWRKHEPRARERLKKAFAALETAPADADTQHELEATLRDNGWADIAGVQARLTRWLDGRRGALEPIACRLAGSLRLAALAPLLQRAAGRLSAPPEVKRAAQDAARRLGMVAAAPAR